MKQENSYSKIVKSSQYALWRESGGPLLSHLDMELTERCNNNCAHCYINLPENDQTAIKRELSTERVKEILVEAVALGCLNVRFTGGEPLLRRDFLNIYEFARKIGLKVTLFTNGTLISEQHAELFACISPMELIQITLYGTNKADYESVTRVPGSFEAAWNGIRLLKKKNIPFILKGGFLTGKDNESDEFDKLAEDNPWMDRPPSRILFLDLRCRRDSETKNRRIETLRPTNRQAVNFLMRDKTRYMDHLSQFLSKFRQTSAYNDLLFTCSPGKGSGCVDAYGKLQACLILRHPDWVYDLDQGNLKNAFTMFFPPFREMKAADEAYLNRCARCFLRSFCEHCPAKSWMEYGVLDRPVEYACEFTHYLAKHLGILIEGEKTWRVSDGEIRLKHFFKTIKPLLN